MFPSFLSGWGVHNDSPCRSTWTTKEIPLFSGSVLTAGVQSLPGGSALVVVTSRHGLGFEIRNPILIFAQPRRVLEQVFPPAAIACICIGGTPQMN